MRVFQYAGTPVTRRHVRHRQIAVTRILPPVQFDDLGKSQVGDQIGNMAGDDDGRRSSTLPQIMLYDRPQGWAMQVIEVRMGYQDQVNRGQIAYSQSGAPQALEYEKPASEIRINDYVLPPHLNKET